MGNISLGIGNTPTIDVDELEPTRLTVPANGVRYIHVCIPDYTELVQPFTHVNIQVEVLQGELHGIYLTPQEKLPSPFRKVIKQTSFSSCSLDSCDKVYPLCHNEHGGICVGCMEPQDNWASVLPKLNSGGLCTIPSKADKVRAKVTSEQGYKGKLLPTARGHQGMTLALRVMPIPPIHSMPYNMAINLPRSDSCELVTGGEWILAIKGGTMDTLVDVKVVTIQPFNPLEPKLGVSFTPLEE